MNKAPLTIGAPVDLVGQLRCFDSLISCGDGWSWRHCSWSLNRPRAAQTVLLDFDAAWDANLVSLASTAGISPFGAAETAQIEALVQSQLEAMYQDFDVSFVTTSPGGIFDTIDFGATGTVLGEGAPRLSQPDQRSDGQGVLAQLLAVHRSA